MSQSVSIEQSIRELKGRKLLLADPASRIRAEMARCLRGVGMEVREAATVPEALAELERFAPDLICIDVDLPGGELGPLIRHLGQRKSPIVSTTSARPSLAIVLTCSARTPRERLVTLITPAVCAVIVSPCRPETMIDRLARVVPGARGSEATGPQHSEPSAVVAVPGLNSVLEHRVYCPFHDNPVESRRFSLRVGKIETEPDFFDVPRYVRAVPGADPVDFHRLAVTVCPECLFASIDPNLFITPTPRGPGGSSAGAGQSLASKLPSAARFAIMSRACQRRQAVGDLPAEFFTSARSLEDAVRSYRLALHCSAALGGPSRTSPPEELVRQGNYHLRLAHVQQSLGQNDSDRDKHIDHASRLLQEAFGSLPEASIPRSVYQVVATCIYKNEDRVAHQYLSKLAQLRKQTTDPHLCEQFNHYLGRCSRAWEDRELHRRVAPVPTEAAVPFLEKAA
jgi:CheY-like chemotaxis protein